MKTLGHEQVLHRFERTFRTGRLASTYLFVGPEGIGKRTFANELASWLLCDENRNQPRTASCGRCESCLLLKANNHPDLIKIAKPEGKSSLPLELFIGRAEHRHREGLCHDIALKPFLASRRIAIIDDADSLGIESANSLLKTLEEPPARSVMILIGTSLARQLPTIRSRCQVVRFAPLGDDQVSQVLQEQHLVPENQTAAAMAAQSDGSVSRALASVDQQLTDFRRQVFESLSRPTFDPIRLATEVLEQSQANSAEPAIKRQRLRTIIAYAIDHHRGALRQAAESGSAPDGPLRRLEYSLAAAEAIDRNANQATVIQTWLTELASSQP